jgi:hypothetical protein
MKTSFCKQLLNISRLSGFRKPQKTYPFSEHLNPYGFGKQGVQKNKGDFLNKVPQLCQVIGGSVMNRISELSYGFHSKIVDKVNELVRAYNQLLEDYEQRNSITEKETKEVV